MPNLNISNLNQGDSQEDIIRKVNGNFDSIVSNGGGPQGQRGKQGIQGAVGPAGPKGDPGQAGTRGTKWFVQALAPAGGPSDPILEGDYWANTASGNRIYQYESTGWVDTGYDLKATEAFKTIEGISGPTGNKNAIVFSSPFPELNTLVLSDSVSTTSTANPTYSKLLISTNGSTDYPLMEFAKTNASGIGTPSDYNRHPQFRWLSPLGSNYDLLFSVPQDSLTIRSGSDLSINSTNGETLFTSDGNFDVNSSGTFRLESSGSMTFYTPSEFLIDSSNFDLGLNSLITSVPFSISSSNTSSYAFSVRNTNPSADAGGLEIDTNNSTSNTYLLDLRVSGTRYFGVRGDGRIEGKRMVQGNTSLTGTSSNASGGYSGSGNVWNIGYGNVNNGNLLLVDLTPGSGNRYLWIPTGSAANSWGLYLDNNTSISYRVVTTDLTKKISGLIVSSGSLGSLDAAFATAVKFVDLTVHRGSGSSSDISVYYNTDAGYAGIIT